MYLAALLLLTHPGAHTSSDAPEVDCANAMTQQDMNWCAGKEYRKADAALNRQWSRTSARMKRYDADMQRYDPEGDGRPGYFDSLLEAQRAWLAYRDAHCRLDGYTARGGSLEPLLASGCKTALTEERARQLRELAESPA